MFPSIHSLCMLLRKQTGACVADIRKSLTAKFIIKKFGGVLSLLLLNHQRVERCDREGREKERPVRLSLVKIQFMK